MKKQNEKAGKNEATELTPEQMNQVSGGTQNNSFYEDHFVYDETMAHSKRKKGLLCMSAWNGGPSK